MSVIQLRGTSGSGKSTIMRQVMKELGNWVPVPVVGRKKALYYVHSQKPWYVLGHYDSPCGGGDTIGSAGEIYQVINDLSHHTGVVLVEGLLLSEDVKHTSQISDTKLLFLTTPLERCLKQIESRRKAAGNEKPLNVVNTSNRVETIERARNRLLELGIECSRATPEQAPGIVVKWVRNSLALNSVAS